MRNPIFKLAIPALAAFIALPINAAVPVDLMKQPITSTNLFAASPAAQMQFKELSRSLDAKKNLHVRIQQTYSGYPVWGGDAVVHIPNGAKTIAPLTAVFSEVKTKNGFMNGIVYQNIAADLANTPTSIFTQTQAEAALQHAIAEYQSKAGGSVSISQQQTQLMVYIDAANKAHWVYKISFYVEPYKTAMLPEKPVYLMDAATFQVYDDWNDIQTEAAAGGGFGGNKKMGKLVYDGLSGDLDKLSVTYNPDNKLCSLMNNDVTVINKENLKVITFSCTATDPNHNNVYWDANQDAVNGGFSPANDALYVGAVIKKLYKDWYNLDVLTKPDGSPMMLKMLIHDYQDNAYWDGAKMVFGDGVDMFYPLTSLGVGAHEISHGFTSQHSNLFYKYQSGGMNESYSDMAAQAAEYYAYGKSSWQIGSEILKGTGSLRYMDKPSKDCNGDKPGRQCSIDDASQFKRGLDVHFSSGVYNRLFYTLATSEGWDTRKAFDVMVQANQHYWTSTTNFAQGACGILSATKDLGYETDAVLAALDVVKINHDDCKV